MKHLQFNFAGMTRRVVSASTMALVIGFAFQLVAPQPANAAGLKLIGVWADPERTFAESFAEIVAYDPATQIVFSTNGFLNRIDRIDISDPTTPLQLDPIDLSPFGGGVNSVAFKNGIGAAAVEAAVVTDPGSVVFFDAAGTFGQSVAVGALPDMLTFTPDGTKVLVANEGEPRGSVDPKGSVSVIDVTGGVLPGDPALSATTIGFTRFDGDEDTLRAQGVRIFPGKLASDDFEPEYIAVSPDGTMAFVSLQEANTLARINLLTLDEADVALLPLGFKDHSLPGNGLDASDRDDAINIANWPVFGLYMPDSIASYEVDGTTYVVTANEGDSRDEDERVRNLDLDPTAFPNAASLQEVAALGRLTVSTIDGDTDGDGDFDQLFAYGARSFSIYDQNGNQVFDSGDDFERITALMFPADFNADNEENQSFDSRSDNKGPEPEALTIAVQDGRTYAFIGLERIGGIMVYDITDPLNVVFKQYVNDRDFGLSEDDLESNLSLHLGPEGLLFIPALDSPTGRPLLLAANEVSGTVSIYAVPLPGTLALTLVGLAGIGVLTRRRRAAT
jgi:2',3'-cyclic-nucleotide 2'-phosphodiesterase / 3'-nucleotidase / 5'-nucleotidase